MFRRYCIPLALFVGASTAACSSDDAGNDTVPAQAVDLTIESFNVALAGAFIPHIAERRQPLLDGIAASDADIVCLQEVWEQADKDAVLDATKQQFPHAVWFAHDLSSALDDATDQNGQVPPVATTPPCGGAELEPDLTAGVDCLSENCSTKPGDEAGQTTSADCAQASCLAQVSALLFGDEAHQRCYACLIVNLPSESFSDIRNLCINEVNADLAFEGQSGVMILSKHPLSNANDYVMPGTYNRRIVASATATLPNGASVDVHCNHLTPIFDSFTRPYTGSYGTGLDGPAGWAAEQLLQAGRVVDYVKQRSGSRPAFILGDLNAGRDYPDATPPIIGEGAATLDLLETSFVPALPADYQPTCTYCDTNANNDTDKPSWIDHIYMHNIDPSAVKSAHRVHDEDVVPVQVDDGNGGTTTALVPLSDHYGISSTVTIPAP